MAHAHTDDHSSHGITDPCNDGSPENFWAHIWFIAIVVIGCGVVYQLSHIDRWMYDNNGEFLDYDAYRDNRHATTSLGSERIDPRAQGDFVTATKRVEGAK